MSILRKPKAKHPWRIYNPMNSSKAIRKKKRQLYKQKRIFTSK